MALMPNPNSSTLTRFLERVAGGETGAWQDLLGECHERLLRMVAVRMDPRLQSRLDPDDILQEVYLDAAQQLPDYLVHPTLPFFLWLRLLTGHWLTRAHRQHLGTQARDAGRDISLNRGGAPAASSAALAAQLLGREPRPSEAAQRAERKLRIQCALDNLDPVDREVLSLRHFEQLTRAEAAQVLGISEAAAGKRYLRALARLKETLTGHVTDWEAL